MFRYSKYHWRIWFVNFFIGVLAIIFLNQEWKVYVPIVFVVPLYLYYMIFNIISHYRIIIYVEDKYPTFFEKHFYFGQLRADNYDLRSLKDDTLNTYIIEKINIIKLSVSTFASMLVYVLFLMLMGS